MGAAETHRRARKHGRHHERYAEEVDDAVPTTLFTRDGATSGVVRVAPRAFRGPSPSDMERALVTRMLSELPPLAPTVDAGHPLSCEIGNVFLAPPLKTDPAPPWAKIAKRLSPRGRKVEAARPKRRSVVPFFALAMAAVLGIGLWCDPPARAKVLLTLAHATSQAGAFLTELALR